jgi:uncharacterized protein
LVKLYADEEGAEAVRRLDAVAVSALARVEVPGALWRKYRAGDLPPEDAAVLTADFEADFSGDATEPPRFWIVGATLSVLERAARLVASHELRAADAVQLASAMTVREADPDCRQFVCFDARLRAAAAANAFELLP